MMRSPSPQLPTDLKGINVRDFLEAAARRDPERLFINGRVRPLRYGEFDDLVNRTARAWQDLGIAKGDRVAVLAENSTEFLLAWLGLAKIGAILVAINTRFKPAEVAQLLDVGRPKLLLVSEALAETAGRAGGALRVLRLPELIARAEMSSPKFERPPLVAEDLVSFIFTSGTTGRPKAVMQTHGNYVLTGQAYPSWLELEDGARLYCCLPLFHINAQAYSTMGAIGSYGTLVLAGRFSASRFWSDVHEFAPSVMNYIGAMIAILMQRDPAPEERGHSLRIAYGAPKFPQDQLEAVEKRFGFTLVSGFGMSETTFGVVESLHHRPPGTIGKPRLHPDSRITNEVRVVDDEGHEVPSGVAGELVIRNPVSTKGYFGDPKRTAEALRDGWLYTGDYATVDEHGYFSFVDRKKDIVRRRGENVSSVEVELVLMNHPSVEEAAVIGVASALTDEDVLAVVVLRPGRSAEGAELVDWCAEHLADFKVPRYVQIVAELPKTATQKVEKTRLRKGLSDSASWYDSEREVSRR
jgi:crotonobetaine/carnitine-CoA ligase